MNRDGYRDQIVTCDVGVSLDPTTHPPFMKYMYSNGTSTQCYAYHYPSLFPVLFLQSLYVHFLFTCLHSFFTCLKQIACLLLLLRQPFLTYGENTIRRPVSHSILTKCVPLFAPVLTAVQILAVRFSHANLSWVRKP